jgi:chemotaxis methyl-accepting protein methylase
LLRARLGHDFWQYKENTLVRRIQRRMQVLQIDSVPEYIDRLSLSRKFVRLTAGGNRIRTSGTAEDAGLVADL